MNKKYIIAVVVAVVVWGAFMGFRHARQKGETEAHREETYRRMIEMAQKSPRSGLHEMAGAITRYHADKKTYPPDLNALYPKYMPSKEFIEKINWQYRAEANNFYLSKSAVFNNQTMVASIDNSMKTEMETSGRMVASRQVPTPKRVSIELEEPLEMIEQAISEDMVLEVLDERAMTLQEVDVVTAAVSPEINRGDRHRVTEEKVNVQAELSRIITLVGDDSVSEQEAQIGYNLEHYMVWKDVNGHIGISNVEFPDRSNMYVAVKNHWYNVKRRQTKNDDTSIAEAQIQVAEKPKDTEEIAADFSRDYLVWKNAVGGIGVGDTQYPNIDRLLIASRDGWDILARPTVSEAEDIQSVPLKPLTAPDIHSVAADISQSYLVWKNQDGSIGVGNTQYPERGCLEVASRSGWSVLEPEPLSGQDEPTGVQSEGSISQDDKLLTAGTAGHYLVWRDKNGQIGFGNVEYPEFTDIDSVHTGGGWQKIVN